MNLTLYLKRNYENYSPLRTMKNEPKTNPNKPNLPPFSARYEKTNPKRTQFKPKTNPIFKRPVRVAQTPHLLAPTLPGYPKLTPALQPQICVRPPSKAGAGPSSTNSNRGPIQPPSKYLLLRHNLQGDDPDMNPAVSAHKKRPGFYLQVLIAGASYGELEILYMS